MAPNSYSSLGPDGLTAAERMRRSIRDILREQLPDRTDDDIWTLTLAVAEHAGPSMPPGPVSLTYAWSDGQTYCLADRAGGIPNDARERSILRALLVHGLKLVDEVEENPVTSMLGYAIPSPA